MLVVVALEAAFLNDVASPALLYVILTIGGALTCLRWPAYTALVTLLAPPAQLARAAALMQLGYAGQQVVAPAVAGLLLGVVGVGGIIAVDLCLSLVALASLLLLPIRTPAIRDARVVAGHPRCVAADRRSRALPPGRLHPRQLSARRLRHRAVDAAGADDRRPRSARASSSRRWASACSPARSPPAGWPRPKAASAGCFATT